MEPRVRKSLKGEQPGKVLSPTEAAYLAGLIDGEGTLSIGRGRRPSYRSGFCYAALMVIHNAEVDALRRVLLMVGSGTLRRSFSEKGPHHKIMYRIWFTPNEIRRVLPQVAPYLLFKHQQAAIVREFLDLRERGGVHITDAEYMQIERLRADVRLLNKRGPGVESRDELPDLREKGLTGRAKAKADRLAALSN